mgnify:CR=1 FL=1
MAYYFIFSVAFANEVGDGEGRNDVGERNGFLQKGDDGSFGATEDDAIDDSRDGCPYGVHPFAYGWNEIG